MSLFLILATVAVLGNLASSALCNTVRDWARARDAVAADGRHTFGTEA